jgi:LacI family transcriptional regulator
MSLFMPSPRQLKPVVPQPGRPLYQLVKEAIRDAIDAGAFKPGEQMPSTKDLGDQLRVSLVTAHRALQELVAAGVLQRAQGRGTFVHERYHDKTRALSDYRVGLVLPREASLTDFYHGEILEGVRRGCDEHAMDLLHLRFGEDVRNECNGYLYVSPPAADLQRLAQRSAAKRKPVMVIGARPQMNDVAWHDAGNEQLGRMAARHLAKLGHRRLGYVGGADLLRHARDRWTGFIDECRTLSIEPEERHILKGASRYLEENERSALLRMLNGTPPPTAIFAAGHLFALNVYAAAATLGLEIPANLSVIACDDPPCAAHLSPPLTTLRQPLIELGRAAIAALRDRMRHDAAAPAGNVLQVELVERQSTAAAGS